MYKATLALLFSINIYLLISFLPLIEQKEFYKGNAKKIVLPLKLPPPPPPPVISAFREANKPFPLSNFSPPDDKFVKAGVVFIIEDGEVLWCKNAQKPYAVASLTKIVTTLLALDYINQDSEINLQTKIPITNKAKATLYSSFLSRSPYKYLTLETLLHSIMFRSANDSSTLIADFFSKKRDLKFFKQMNSYFTENNYKTARFYNPHGLPNKNLPDNSISVKDLTYLAKELITKYPIVLDWTRHYRHTYFKPHKKSYKARNTNNLTEIFPGIINGLKTGFTKKAGRCLALTWKSNNKTILAILLGFSQKSQRTKFAKDVFLWTNRHLAIPYKP